MINMLSIRVMYHIILRLGPPLLTHDVLHACDCCARQEVGVEAHHHQATVLRLRKQQPSLKSTPLSAATTLLTCQLPVWRCYSNTGQVSHTYTDRYKINQPTNNHLSIYLSHQLTNRSINRPISQPNS